jgi:hypothetical protein
MFRRSTNKAGAMTSREVIDLFSLKSGLDIPYRDLCKAMNECSIQLRSRRVNGQLLTSYIGRDDIHQLAYYFGVELYHRRGR